MFLDILILAASLGLILLSSILFTNGIELLGHRMNLHQGAVGSILAAVGTALPETIIPIIAILVFHSPQAQEVGVGAIAGAPFMLATLAFFVTGAAVLIYSALGRRTIAMEVEPEAIERDLGSFLCIYGVAILASFVHEIVWLKGVIALFLLASYPWYLRRTLKAEVREMENLEPLIFSRLFKVPETGRWVAVQVILSLLIMIASAHLFIHYVTRLSAALGIAPLIISIIITPIATELPEKCNSVIWVGKKKDILALGNITGAMVFQGSFPVVFGVLFTPWDLRGIPMVTAILAFVSALLVLAWVKIRKSLNAYALLAGGLFYAAFLVYMFRVIIHR